MFVSLIIGMVLMFFFSAESISEIIKIDDRKIIPPASSKMILIITLIFQVVRLCMIKDGNIAVSQINGNYDVRQRRYTRCNDWRLVVYNDKNGQYLFYRRQLIYEIIVYLPYSNFVCKFDMVRTIRYTKWTRYLLHIVRTLEFSLPSRPVLPKQEMILAAKLEERCGTFLGNFRIIKKSNCRIIFIFFYLHSTCSILNIQMDNVYILLKK